MLFSREEFENNPWKQNLQPEDVIYESEEYVVMGYPDYETMVGKGNMDRNGSEELQEESAQASADATVQWIEDTLDKFENVKPILTPRFTPSCSDELMEKLSEIQKRYHLPMQSQVAGTCRVPKIHALVFGLFFIFSVKIE